MAEDLIQSDLETVQDFIYDEYVQKKLDKINNILLPINFFEISGMGDQEIKHSNILSWMFGDNQHQFGFQILSKFLGKVTEIKEGINENNKNLTNLRHYAYFPENERDIEIKREWEHIDLLIEDKSNKVVIVIENKVRADESENQLKYYETATNEKQYSRRQRDENGIVTEETKENWDIYYIFLTPDGRDAKKGQGGGNEASVKQPEENWLSAKYQIIYEIVENTLEKPNQDIPDEAKMILKSYNDLLIKEGIVENKYLEKLCADIWGQKNYSDALKILIKHEPSNNEKIYKLIEKHLKKKFPKINFLTKPNTNNRFSFQTEAIDEKLHSSYYFLRFLKDEGLYLDFNLCRDIDIQTKEILWKNSWKNSPLKKGNHSVKLSKNDNSGWNDLIENVNADLSKFTEREDFKKIIEAIKNFDDELIKMVIN